MSAFSGRVTPADILRALEEAKAVHKDPERLQRAHDQLVAEVGGIEELADQWTFRNLLEDYGRELRRWPESPVSPPRKPGGKAAERAKLRELIQRFPDLAREILGDDYNEAPGS